ncbi:MAG TPA: glycoside hydrolase family 15 protein [Dictyobacter sp.]|nr:glycoside hydrolase family 15 protein [Dictyobacter sp.]
MVQTQSQQKQEPSRFSERYVPIEDYGVIGNLHTVALVGKNGSIDWCCLPRFDSPSLFGAILDADKGGGFRIAPLDADGMGKKQLYLPDTNILITRFLTADGVGEITDFMPIKLVGSKLYEHHLVRIVQAVRGSMIFEMHCHPACNYGRDTHTVVLSVEGAVFHSDSICLALAATVPLEESEAGAVRSTFTLYEGQKAYFFLESAREHDIAPHKHPPAYYEEAFRATKRYWQNWIAHSQYHGRWREMVHRSALALKLLTYAPTGAIVAAPTTSLPETVGSERNWDYRFTWLRDAAFTIYSLLILGFTDEAEAFMGWLEARCRELKPNGSLQPMYGIDGRQDLTEITLDHLEGYRQSHPVRIGNGAYTQQQLDIYGEMLDSIFIFNRHKDISYDLWENVLRLLDWLKDHWQEPDEGIWEVRGGQQHFLHSRLMSWVAFDRALRITRHRGLPAPLNDWAILSSKIYKEIIDQGWNKDMGCFVQYYGSNAVDASALLMVLMKFMGPNDPRIISTLERIKKDLVSDSHVYRYNPSLAANDGFGGIEGTFSICSFWLVEALARSGQLEDARLILEKIFSYANHLGLYAEEVGATGEALGNFPQAFTHLSLISACYNLDRALNSAGRH